MELGWVKLHRKILDNPVFRHDKTAKALFIDLLLLVNEHGWYDTGRYKLADITGVKPMTIYKALIRLESTEMITLESNNKYTRIHINKWANYQSRSNTTHNNKVTSKEHQSNIKVTLNKNKEYRIKNNTTNVVLGADAPAQKISKLYYEVIKSLDVPVKNHNNVKAKIQEMGRAHNPDELIQYLEFMRDKYASLQWEFKPDISEALDIHSKRTQIINTLKRAKGDNSVSKGVKL